MSEFKLHRGGLLHSPILLTVMSKLRSDRLYEKTTNPLWVAIAKLPPHREDRVSRLF